MNPKKLTSKGVFHANPLLASKALQDQLDNMVVVGFAFAWDPGPNSAVFVRAVAANGVQALPANGVMDPASPFAVPLGVFAAGAFIKISWSVRAYADLNGIRAFARAGAGGVWAALDQKVPLRYQEEWITTAEFQVMA